jgi:hypothetical protein
MRSIEQRKTESHPSSTFFGPKIQKKLKTGTVGDKYEVEADKVADKVVNNNAKGTNGLFQSKKEDEIQQKPISESITAVQSKEMKEEEPVQKKEEEEKIQKKEMKEEEPVQKKEEEEKVQKKEMKEEEPVQAKCDECEKEDKVQKKGKEEEEKPVQTKSNTSQTESRNDNLEGKLGDSKGSGNAMDKTTKQEMEAGFGSDFSNVRVHTDSNAIQMSQELGAQAFTHGNDIYFNKGKYNPDSKEGKHLLAHELTHTIQQTGNIQKSVIPSSSEDRNLQAESPEFKGDYKLEQVLDEQDYLTNGSRGLPVKKVQDGLTRLGFELPQYGIDGIFGNETKQAVLDFQDTYGLTYDGIVGEQTMGTLDNIHAQKNGKEKKPPKKKKCEIFNRFKFSSEPVHIEPLVTTQECKSFLITLKTTKDKNENPCSTYNVIIQDSSGKTVKGPISLAVGQLESFNFTTSKVDQFSMIISTPHSCGENAFSGKGTKHRQ